MPHDPITTAALNHERHSRRAAELLDAAYDAGTVALIADLLGQLDRTADIEHRVEVLEREGNGLAEANAAGALKLDELDRTLAGVTQARDRLAKLLGEVQDERDALKAQVRVLEDAIARVVTCAQVDEHAAMADARKAIGEEAVNRYLAGQRPVDCACGSTATMGARCMACASRESE